MPNTAEDKALAFAEARAWARTGRGRAARQAAGVPLKLVADHAGRDLTTINQWELGNLRPTGDAAILWLELMQKLEAVVAQEGNAPAGTGAFRESLTPDAGKPDATVPQR
jgi:transcriptional regulator with XRE-family HTH domain